MSDFNLFFSAICLSLSCSISAMEHNADTGQSGIPFEFNVENLKVSALSKIKMKATQTHEDIALSPYRELTVAITTYRKTFRNIESNLPGNIAIDYVNDIADHIDLMIDNLTTISCNRITFAPLIGDKSDITVNDKTWTMHSQYKNESFFQLQGRISNPLEVNSQDIRQVTFLEFSDGMSRILFELDGMYPSDDKRTIRHIMIDY